MNQKLKQLLLASIAVATSSCSAQVTEQSLTLHSNNQHVAFYLTNADQSSLFQQQLIALEPAKQNDLPTINVSAQTSYQEIDGFGYSELKGIVVKSNQNTTVDNMALFLSTGVDGYVTINSDSATSSSRTVTINLFHSNDATLMKVSEDIDFLNVPWEAVTHSKSYTLTVQEKELSM